MGHALLSTEYCGHFNYTSDSHWNTLYCPLNTGVASTKEVTRTRTRSTVHKTLWSPQLNTSLTLEYALLSIEHWGSLNYTSDSQWGTLYCPLNTGVASNKQVTHTGIRSTVHWTLGSPQLKKWLALEHALLSTKHCGRFN
jgi:hypothetical protein